MPLVGQQGRHFHEIILILMTANNYTAALFQNQNSAISGLASREKHELKTEILQIYLLSFRSNIVLFVKVHLEVVEVA